MITLGKIEIRKVLIFISLVLYKICGVLYDAGIMINWYYESWAIAFLIVVYLTPKSLGFMRRMLLFIAGAQVFDEFLGNPLTFGFWDYAWLLLFIIWELLKLRKMDDIIIALLVKFKVIIAKYFGYIVALGFGYVNRNNLKEYALIAGVLIALISLVFLLI